MDLQGTEDIKTHLVQTSEEFRDLAQQHQSLKARVFELENNPLATEDDELEEQRLKKLKLHVKDQMEEIVSRYKEQHA